MSAGGLTRGAEMRVVCPHIGQPHPRTKAVLDSWPNVTYVDVSGSDTAYSELICELWADASDDLLIVEHDVVPWPWMYAEFTVCDKPFCAGIYPWRTNVGPALGLTRFSSLFMRHLSDAAREAASIDGGYGAGSWRQFDYWLMRTVLEEKHGWTPHLHLPPCEHENEAKRLVEPFRSYSLATHLRMVGYELAGDGRSAKWVGRFRRAVVPPTTPR